MSVKSGKRKLPGPGETVTVIGAGRSGVAAARLAHALGYRVRLLDEGPVSGETRSELREVGIEVLENHPLSPLEVLSLPWVIVSPGIPPRKWAGQDAPLYLERVMGEMEWASRWTEVPLLAVGGTNGKSTTSALLAHLLEAAGERVFLGGNFGTPLSEMVLMERKSGVSLHSVGVVELSSFQAETMGDFHPVVNLLLNITPDHLDRYPSLEAYRSAKWKAFESMAADSFAVVNRDPACGAFPVSAGVVARKVWFWASREPAPAGFQGLSMEAGGHRAFLDGLEGVPPLNWNLSGFQLEGMGNRQNLAAALAGAALFLHQSGRKIDDFRLVLEQAVSTFRGLPHRMEVVGEWGGVRFVNDSKATNVDATRLALEGYSGRGPAIHLIMGGRDKGAPYAPLQEGIRMAVKSVVALGEAREKIRSELGEIVPFSLADSLEEAVSQAAARAISGDRVLLSPACSSYDMFHGYEERGRIFREIVEAWIRGRGAGR